MKARGFDARGVAVIDDRTSESDLDAMGSANMRGIRLNLATGSGNDPSAGRQRFQAAVDRMKSRGWHVQMYTNLAVISGIKDLVLASPVPVVFDHFGGAQAALGPEQPGFADLAERSVPARLMSKFPAPIGHRSRRPTTRTSPRSPRH
jgi:predicted TIM-barrel fold metal-dependent hydrolase